MTRLYALSMAFILLFFVITFIQSALDKFMNSKENIDWFSSVFGSTFLGKIIVPLFWILSIEEIAIGLYSLYAAGLLLLAPDSCCTLLKSYYALIGNLFVLLQLFSGQRIAKDYVGASGIVPYIILAVAGIVLYFQLNSF